MWGPGVLVLTAEPSLEVSALLLLTAVLLTSLFPPLPILTARVVLFLMQTESSPSSDSPARLSWRVLASPELMILILLTRLPNRLLKSPGVVPVREGASTALTASAIL